MSLLQNIPVESETTDQTIDIELGLNPYILRILWNERFGYFSLSIATADDAPIITNIKMVTDYPLIGRFKSDLSPIGDLYFVQEKGDALRPGYSDLGVNFGLYYYEADIVPDSQPVRLAVGVAVLGTLWDSTLTTWDAGLGGSTWDI